MRWIMEYFLKRLTKRAVFLLFICFCFPLSQFPDTGLNVSEVGEWGGYASSYLDVTVSGNHAYCVGKNGLDIVDVSTPSLPRLMASYPESGYMSAARR